MLFGSEVKASFEIIKGTTVSTTKEFAAHEHCLVRLSTFAVTLKDSVGLTCVRRRFGRRKKVKITITRYISQQIRKK